MSGTLERGNRKRIAFLPYRDTPDGEIIDLSNNPSTRTIPIRGAMPCSTKPCCRFTSN
jgi:hypothetical protein